MAFMVLILGLFSVAIGFAMIGFGIPINEFGLGNTLISAGVTSFTGGIILLGLAAAVRQLERIVEALPVRKGARTARVGDIAAPPIPPRNGPRLPQPPRVPTPDSATERREPRAGAPVPGSFSFDAIERMRSTIPRVDRAPESAPADQEDETPLSPHAAPFPMPRPVPAETTADAGSRLSFPWRTRPRNSGLTRDVQPGQPAAADTSTIDPPRTDSEPEAPAAILKSGVVDGMAYTLYADGSIEAKLPEGIVRFDSIGDLRGHLEKNG